jgi:hypothetical protein
MNFLFTKKFNSIIKFIIVVIIYNLLFINIFYAYYIPDPVFFAHGRGMYVGDNWDILDNMDGEGKVLSFIQSYGVPIYLVNSFSGRGFGSLEDWGNEFKNWIDLFIEDYNINYGLINKFKIVGYSAGGLASRWFLAKYGYNYKNKIERVITLHTPHQGAYLPYVSEIVNYGSWGFMTLAVFYSSIIAACPLLATVYTSALNSTSWAMAIFYTLRILTAGKLLPPPGILNKIDIDLMPESGFQEKLHQYEDNFQYKTKYKIVYGNRFFWNMGPTEMIAWKTFLAMLLIGEWEWAFVPLGEWLFGSLLYEGDMASLDKSQTGELGWPLNRYGAWFVSKESGINKEFIRTDVNHLEIPKKGKIILECLEDSPVISIENSNTLTAVKMEPDGVYINIQHPIIHIDGSCDDYLIQWMGDNDRVRLRYDKYANVNEVVHLKNTEEGVFDYQRAGDVGRGWFSQKHTLQLGGENKIRIVAKNAADEESNNIARTYYSVGLRYPEDGEKGREMGEAVVWYEKDKLTGDIAKKKFVVSVTDGNFPEYIVDITGKELAGEWPYLYSAKSRLIGNQIEGEHNRDIEGVTITANEIKFSIRNYFYRDGYIEIFGNADGAKYNSANKIFVKII